MKPFRIVYQIARLELVQCVSVEQFEKLHIENMKKAGFDFSKTIEVYENPENGSYVYSQLSTAKEDKSCKTFSIFKPFSKNRKD